MNTFLSSSNIIDLKKTYPFQKKHTTPTEIWKPHPRHHAVRGLRHRPEQPHYWKSALYCRSVLKVYFFSSKNLENSSYYHKFGADNIIEWAVLRDSSPKRNGGATSVEMRYFASPLLRNAISTDGEEDGVCTRGRHGGAGDQLLPLRHALLRRHVHDHNLISRYLYKYHDLNDIPH